MDRSRKTELFEEIRRDYTTGEAIGGIAKKYGVHRRMARRALASAIPFRAVGINAYFSLKYVQLPFTQAKAHGRHRQPGHHL